MTNILKQKLNIKGMHCSSCAMLIDMDLEDLSGVVKVDTNYAKQLSVVEYDSQKVTVQDIVTTIEKTGYKASPED